MFYRSVTFFLMCLAVAGFGDAAEAATEKQSPHLPMLRKDSLFEKRVSEEVTAPQKAAEKPVADKEPAKETAAPQESAEKPVADKEPAKEAAAPQETAQKPIVDKETTKGVIAPQETAKKPVADKESAKETIAPEDATVKQEATEEKAISQPGTKNAPAQTRDGRYQREPLKKRVPKKNAVKKRDRTVIIEAQVAYFRPTSTVFRDIYGSALVNYRFDFNLQLLGDLYLMLDTNFLYKKGDSVGLGTRTKLFFVPLDFGLKYFFPPVVKGFEFYLKAAAEITAAFLEHDTVFISDVSDSAAGGVVGFGGMYTANFGMVAEVFFDYSFVKLNHFGDIGEFGETREIGGLLIGAGIGYKF